MSAFFEEKVLSVHHWTDTLFSFTCTRDSAFRFKSGQFTMIGLLVDAVSDILMITDDMVQVAPDVACDRVRSFVRGLISLDSRMISLIALDRLLPELDQLAA